MSVMETGRRSRRHFLGLGLGLALGLAGCAQTGPTVQGAVGERGRIQDFYVEGRFALRQETKSYAGKLTWDHRQGRDEVLLMSPLGQGAAEIVQDRDGARLTTADHRYYQAADGGALVRDVLGYELPLAHMSEWLLARTVPGTGVRRDAVGRVRRFTESGWEVEYGYGDEGGADALPQSMTARYGDAVELRLHFDAWRLDGDAS